MNAKLINYVECGTGPALLLIHGWGMDHTVWNRCIPVLSKRFRVIAVDLRGHGRSSVGGAATLEEHGNDLRDLLRYLGIMRVGIVGWSLGAQVAISMALQSAPFVCGMVLIGATPQFVQSPSFPHGLPLVELAGMKKKVSISPARSMDGFRGLLFSDYEQKHSDYLAARKVLEGVAVPPAEVLLTGLAQLQEVSLLGVVSAVQCPVLLIHGSHDRVCPIGAGRVLADALAHATLLELHQAGHAPFVTMPDRVTEAIGGFFERIEEW